jgi:Fe-S cluster biogenesis protein NfuA
MSKTREELGKEIEDVLMVLREGIAMHGGDVELISADPLTGRVEVRMVGACVGCPMSEITLKAGIEDTLRELVPEVKEVVQVE